MTNTSYVGFDEQGAGDGYPPLHWYVQLPSGLRHWFTTRAAAEASQYAAGVEYARCNADYREESLSDLMGDIGGAA